MNSSADNISASASPKRQDNEWECSMNIGSLLTEAARAAPERVAIIHGDLRRSYREINVRADRLAAVLERAGIGKGDRVAILQYNCPQLLETLFGIFKAGAVAVPINARSHPKEYSYIIADCGARAIVFGNEFLRGLESVRGELPTVSTFVCVGNAHKWAMSYELLLQQTPASHADIDCEPDDVAWLFYTSGTTGKPKGAMVTHANLRFMSDHYPREVYTLRDDDIVLHAGPLTHGSGLWSLPITAGAGTHLIPTCTRFDPEHIFKLIETERVTKIAFVAPTMITMLLNSPTIDAYDMSSLRFIGYGGSPMYVEDLKRAVRRWGPILCQIYGQGECPMTITMLTPRDHRLTDDSVAQRRLASAGRARGDISVAILDDNDRELGDEQIGEIAVRGEVVMKGYWNKPEATAEAFKSNWYHTGDLGKRDADGYIYLLDRKKELIISGGANIYPREVEEVLLLHPGVLEAAVIGVPDRLWGESVVAVIRPRPGADPSEEELIELCRAHLAGYKKPRLFRFVSDLPKNAYGKILKRELRDQMTAKMGESAA
jgi:acyl-CoA synthetase (AMP-forming)/AMP-acid ligase II